MTVYGWALNCRLRHEIQEQYSVSLIWAGLYRNDLGEETKKEASLTQVWKHATHFQRETQRALTTGK